ncbi:MAG: hypothetical protein LC799_27080 [Actinobacteria bacterium]|nr:hypothetical protein [Actinomycetota bacterium]
MRRPRLAILGVVGATKVTGTGSGADYWVMVDAGASCVADFTDLQVEAGEPADSG